MTRRMNRAGRATVPVRNRSFRLTHDSARTPFATSFRVPALSGAERSHSFLAKAERHVGTRK